MLPTLVLVTCFLLKSTCSSPVYNMQPAYITATIGSTGRNIRNLPCISRKSNQSGVCMFAIDCLKANGTHLGTCIDRFYFGSCCRIEQVHDVSDNTIDTALIPSRQPPSRVTSTTERRPITQTTEKSKTTISKSTTEKLNTTTVNDVITKLTTIAKVTQSTLPSSVYVTKKPFTATKKPVENDEITVPYKLTTFQSVDNEETTTFKPNLSSKKPKPSSVRPTTSIKPKPTILPQIISVTQRPTHRPISKFTIKTKPTRPQSTKLTKATKATIKPVVTNKPESTLSKNTLKPAKVTLTTPSILNITEKRTKPTSQQLVSTTLPTRTTIVTKVTNVIVTNTVEKPTTTYKPVLIAEADDSITTTEKNIKTTPTTSTTKLSETTNTTNLAPNVTTPISHITQTTDKITTQSNELPIAESITAILESLSGNPLTNEIEPEKPINPSTPSVEITLPSLVTWSQLHESTSVESPTSSTEAEDWVPITTPDGWVLLPSLSTITEPSLETTTTTSFDSIENTTKIASSSTASISTNISLASSEFAVESNSTTSMASLTSENSTSTSIDVTTQKITTASNSGVNMSDFTDVCGRRMFPEARIVGGEKSSFGKWPWQISLRQWRTSTYLHKCGAALLNENWAITAAHCVDNVPPSDLLLRLGEHDLSTESEPYLHQERRVQIVASHPQFDPRTFEYDLALLRFYEPVPFQPNIIPVCVPQNDENFVGRTAYVTGWGRLYEDGPLPSVLQEVSVPVINNTVCESMYRSAGYIEHIPNIFICAGWRRGGFDSCEGDSGGPMVIQRPDKRFLLAGVISWGIGCAEPNQPGVYTRISEFRDWINQILQF